MLHTIKLFSDLSVLDSSSIDLHNMISANVGLISFLLLFPLVATICNMITVTAEAPNSTCDRSCASATVPYPFGFSAGCPIRLNCSTSGQVLLGGYFSIKNITAKTVLLSVPPLCNRSTHAAAALFGDNYAVMANNSFFLRNCSTWRLSSAECSIMAQRWNLASCGPPADAARCYYSDRAEGFHSREAFLAAAAGCDFLFSSVMYQKDDPSQTTGFPPTPTFGLAELGWWLHGECRCAANASCTRVDVPQSASGNGTGFRCSCPDGLVGDGFADGGGCWDAKNCTHFGTCGSRARTGVLIGGSAAGAVVFVFASVVVAAIFLKKRRTRNSFWNKSENLEALFKDHGSLVPRRFEYSELRRITKSFREKLGQGGYGSVFKGTLEDGRQVAVKILRDAKKSGDDFMNEVASISRTSHVNIVSLQGFCFDEGSKRALVYEFMSNGSLEKHIFSSDHKPKAAALSWDVLYKIAVGIARGLEYLHRGCSTRIVHLDIKPHNVLLDEEFCPKISDFGLAKLCPKKVSVVSMEDARGTIGYIAPEVVSRNFGMVSTKSDVYSYGMMVLEMTAGRRNMDADADRESQVYFPHWVYEHLDEGAAGAAGAADAEAEEMARKMILVGLWCIQTYPEHRPSMSRVVEMLEGRVGDMELPPKPSFASSLHAAAASITSSSAVECSQLSGPR